MINGFLIWATRNAPMRCIYVRGEPYLQRYYMGSLLGRQVWLHRFLRNDAEPHLHNHSWRGLSIVLRGGYLEELLQQIGGVWVKTCRFRSAPSAQMIELDHTHRIAEVVPDTWTLMLVGKTRRDTWEFVGEGGRRETMPSSGSDWWRFCKKRAEQESGP